MQYTDKYRSPLGRNNPSQRWRPPDRIMVRRAKKFCRHFIGGTPRKRTADIRVNQKSGWIGYFMGKIPSFTPPIHLKDTPFRLAVWDLLSKIPYGEVVTTRSSPAKSPGKGILSMPTQAIGGAVGHNPISIIIPCHRVVGSDGSLTGYAGGIDKKEPAYNRTGPKSIVKRLYLANPCVDKHRM